MPPQPLPWVDFPATSTPANAAALTGLETRTSNYVGSSEIGTGVGAAPDFQVLQSGGGSLQILVGVATGALQRAFLPGDSNGGTNRVEYAGVQMTATATASDPTNPRIDSVVLSPPASQNSSVPLARIVKGTATGGATLANRTGAPAVPAGSILLADILVAAGATTILTAQIADRRAYPFAGVNPSVFSVVDQVVPESTGGLQAVATGVTQGTNDLRAAAMFVWLPRRIFAGRLRWHYRQGATAAVANYQWFIFDASGRLLLLSALTAFTSTAGLGVSANLSFSPLQLEAGGYWLGFQVATLGAGASVNYQGFQGVQNGVAIPGVAAPNLYGFAAGNPFGAATATVGNSLADAFGVTTDTAALPVPTCSIGV